MEALKVYMGHSSITVTIDLYGYLMEGTEAIDAGQLDALLAAAAWEPQQAVATGDQRLAGLKDRGDG
jgi:hypothetical protein